MDNIKKLLDDIVDKANGVRYIFYNYYLDSWSSSSVNKEVLDLKNGLRTVLTAITDKETIAIDHYLYAKGFINMTPGSQLYNAYTDALSKNKIYIDGKDWVNKIKFEIYKDYYERKCGFKGEKYAVYDPYDATNFKLNYGADFFYRWKPYDYGSRKYIAESNRPQNVVLKDGSTCNYTIRDCTAPKIDCRDNYT
jgi:hypothetical protein